MVVIRIIFMVGDIVLVMDDSFDRNNWFVSIIKVFLSKCDVIC